MKVVSPFGPKIGIIKIPKKADPVQAAHINLLKPLKGAFVSLNNFFFNSGSIFDIRNFEHKLKFSMKNHLLKIAGIAQR